MKEKSFTKEEVEKDNKIKTRFKKKYFRVAHGEKPNIRIRGQMRKTRGWNKKEVTQDDISEGTSNN